MINRQIVCAIFIFANSLTDNKLLFEHDLYASNDVGAAAKEPTELFTKNTGLCEHESGCIGADSCPVLEG